MVPEQNRLKNLVQQKLNSLTEKTKQSLGDIKKIALSEAWKILQLAIVDIVQAIEKYAETLPGKDKKTIAMDLLSKFYDTTFVVIDIPVVPNILEPIIHRYVKSLLMILVSSSIDATVTTLKELGIFSISPQESINSLQTKKIKKNTTKKKGNKK